MTRWVWGVLLACAGCGGSWGGGAKAPDPAAAAAAPKEEVFSVGVAPLTIGSISRSLTGSGTLRGAREVDLSAQVEGLLVERRRDVGARVVAGEVLARLEDASRRSSLQESELRLVAARGRHALAAIALEEQVQAIARGRLRVADARIARDKAALAQLDAQRDHATKLRVSEEARAQGKPSVFSADELNRLDLNQQQLTKELARAELAIKQAEIDEVSAEIKQRELQGRLAEAQREIAEAELARDKAQLELDKVDISATIDGVVTECLVEPGARIAAGTVCFRVVDTTAYYLDLRLPEAELAVLHPGQRALLLTAQAPLPVASRLTRIDPSVDPKTGTVGVRITAPDRRPGLPPELAGLHDAIVARLRRGMFARVQLLVETRPRAKLVRPESIVYESQQPHVYVVREGKAERIAVVLGFAREGAVEVQSDQLDEGMPVIVAGQRLVQPGSPVRIVARS